MAIHLRDTCTAFKNRLLAIASGDAIGPGPAPAFPRPQLTLRVGVTGHMALDDAAIGRQIERAFGLCAEALEAAREPGKNIHAKDPPLLTLISGAAAGADQLAVEIFQRLALDPPPAGAQPIGKRVEAVLPFSVDDYASTMTDYPAAIPRLRAIARAGDDNAGQLAPAERVMILADRALREDMPADPAADANLEENRFKDQRYAALGDVIVRQADILISVWNGVKKNAIGGTSHVTAQALRMGVPVLWVDTSKKLLKLMVLPPSHGDVLDKGSAAALTFGEDTPAEPSPAYKSLRWLTQKILVPDAMITEGFREKYAGEDEKHPPSAKGVHGAVSAKDQITRFFGCDCAPESLPRWTSFLHYKRWVWALGADVTVDKTRLSEIKAAEKSGFRRWWPLCLEWHRMPRLIARCDYVAGDLAGAHAKTEAEKSFRDLVAAPWAFTDAVATRLGHVYRSCYFRIFLLGALVVLCALFGAIRADWHHTLTCFELALLAGMAAIYFLNRHYNVHARYLNARGMSEEMRPVWTLAQLGLGGRRTLNAGAPWTAWAVQSWSGGVGLPEGDFTRQRLARIAAGIQSGVVEDQKQYHIDNNVRLRRLHHALESLGFGALLLAVVVTVVFVVAGFVHPDPLEHYVNIALLAGAGLPAIAAALTGTRYHGDFERFAQRSAKTAGELDRIGKVLQTFIDNCAMGESLVDRFAELRDILGDLETVLLNDLDDWRFVYRARPTPAPG